MITYHFTDRPVLLIKDEASIKFHAEADDYFGTLATTLSLWKQEGVWPETEYQALQKDLKHLQAEYLIRKKPG